jgi:hypothetical protein
MPAFARAFSRSTNGGRCLSLLVALDYDPLKGWVAGRPLARAAMAGVLAATAGCSRGADRPAAPDTVAAGPVAGPGRASRDVRAGGEGEAASPTWHVTFRGVGSLRFGMSLGAAAASVGGALRVRPRDAAAACTYAAWAGGPPGVRVMVERGRIVRVDVERPSTLTTAEGIGVGAPEADVEQGYPGQVRVAPAKYSTGRVLTVTPPGRADPTARLVFEIEEGRVARYRAGERPAVEYVEGCG